MSTTQVSSESSLVLTQLELLELMSEADTVARRQRIIDRHRISAIIDVGANKGQFVREVRAGGYTGRVISSEPLPEVYAELERRTLRDPLWACHNSAIGDRNGRVRLGVSGNSVSSSTLPTLDSYTTLNPHAAYVDHVDVPVRTLDDAVARLGLGLKIDVQGSEDAVLDGAASVLLRCCMVETELSLHPLYDGQVLAAQMIDRLNDAGFYLASVERGFTHPLTGQLMQADAIFIRHGCPHHG